MTPIMNILIASLAGLVIAYLLKQKMHARQLARENAQLKQTNAKQAGEIQQKNSELHSAKIRKTHQQNVRVLSDDGVDRQLQQHHWFRDGE